MLIDYDSVLLEDYLRKDKTVDLSGTWYSYYAKVENREKECSISHSGSIIYFHKENGSLSDGEFISKNQV